MREGINKHDRMILICSKHSLDRPGVLNEIEEVLAREAREGGTAYLIRIRLDDYLFRQPLVADLTVDGLHNSGCMQSKRCVI